MEVSMSSASEMVGPSSFTPTSTPSTEDVLNKNYPSHNGQSKRQFPSMDASRNLFPEEALLFTTSARNGPNLGEFYFKHIDTDSEKDELDADSKNMVTQMETDSKNVEESSEEDEWTYKDGGEGGDDSPVQTGEGSLCQSTETLASASKSVKHEQVRKPSIEKLIERADKMVQSPARRPREFLQPLAFCSSAGAKSKVSDWLKSGAWDAEDSKTQGESCDASGEFSTEEEGHSSGDFNTSVIHCHESAEVLPSPDSPASAVPNTPQSFKISGVVLRAKRIEGTHKRPLSESGLPPPQLPTHLPLSRSESALNQMDSTPTNSVKMDASVQGTLSSSTTVEEIVSQAQEGSSGGYNTNSLRKRKIKLKKRNLGKKSESGGSDSHDPASPQKAVAPSIVRRLPASGTETEEEMEGDTKLRASRRKLLTQPLFRLGPDHGGVTIYSGGDKALSADSSFSEQAWDNYQEKYMSEAYSEDTPDPETVRKVLEFGDDYRQFLDSQSDGASSRSLSRPPSFHRRRRQLMQDRDSPGLESDAEGHMVRNIINKSLYQLNIAEQSWNHFSEATPHFVMINQFEEHKYMCNENIRVLESIEMDKGFSEDFPEIKGLIERWASLETRLEELQKMRSLQREMSALREELLDLTKRVSTMEHEGLQDRDQLEMKICHIKLEQASLRERKSQLLEINKAVHKFFTDSGQQEQLATRLKEDVNELYFLWEETNKRVSQQVDSLSQLSVAWQTFESHLTELQVALREDHKTLHMLDSALQDGPVSQDVASSVIDVAKVLSEKQDHLCYQNVCALGNTTTPVILSLPSSTEGSLSDSGISDSGSEQESERERRLSALRRLARQLEAVLSPNSQAILDMSRRIEQTESELRGLQKTCRELIVRTAVCADARAQRQDNLSPSTLFNRTKKNASSGPQSFMELDPDDDDPDPDKTSVGWLWRVIRAALPFQVAIVAIFCVAYLLEPHCCDSMNNLNFSLTPQLRYMRGPPPV